MSLRFLHRAFGLLALTLAVTAVGAFGVAGWKEGDLRAVILPQVRNPVPWRFIEPSEVIGGVSVPPSTHVVFHLPQDMERTTLDVLFGLRDDEVRFWGYCLPPNYDPQLQEDRTNLPGQLFLSDRERKIRDAAAVGPTTPDFSLFRLPSLSDLRKGNTAKGRIRHEMDVFVAGSMCYVMAEEALALGIDRDGDGLNGRLEFDIGTRPDNPDTDADGIADGVEYRSGTDPLRRDTDLDGLPDGIEDANWNGRVNPGETDPRNPDSDRDDLCDGLCMLKLRAGNRVYIGEDRNLNGRIDEKETDPLNADTDGDGTSDYQEWIMCQMAGKKDC